MSINSPKLRENIPKFFPLHNVPIYVFGENFMLINLLFPQNSNKFHPDVAIIK
jgi:hypothetical protein